jgi:hypothetical protein
MLLYYFIVYLYLFFYKGKKKMGSVGALPRALRPKLIIQFVDKRQCKYSCNSATFQA